MSPTTSKAITTPTAWSSTPCTKRMAQTMTTREMLEAAGFRSTEKTRAWARSVLRPLTEEQRAENRRRLELLERGEWPGEEA